MKLVITKTVTESIDLTEERVRINNPKVKFNSSERFALNTLLDYLEQGEYEKSSQYFFSWPKRGDLYLCTLHNKYIIAKESWREYVKDNLFCFLYEYNPIKWEVMRII